MLSSCRASAARLPYSETPNAETSSVMHCTGRQATYVSARWCRAALYKAPEGNRRDWTGLQPSVARTVYPACCNSQDHASCTSNQVPRPRLWEGPRGRWHKRHSTSQRPASYTQRYRGLLNDITECPTAVSRFDNIRAPSSPHFPLLLFCTPPAWCLSCMPSAPHHVSAQPFSHAPSTRLHPPHPCQPQPLLPTPSCNPRLQRSQLISHRNTYAQHYPLSPPFPPLALHPLLPLLPLRLLHRHLRAPQPLAQPHRPQQRAGLEPHLVVLRRQLRLYDNGTARPN